MAHELEIIDGEAQMFYRGQTPWHGLGRMIKEEINVEQAIVAAGLDWTVSTQSVFLGNGNLIKDSKATVRDVDGSVLGVVGKGYTPLQNIDAFKFFNPFVETGLASFETAGSLRDGKRVWILAKINKDPMVIANGDEVEKYVLLSNTHDGTMAVRAGFTPIRVVCNNTLQMAVGNDASQLIRIRHSLNVKENLEKVSEIMNLANQKFEATAEQYRFLASRQIVQADLEKYVKLVLVGEKKMVSDDSAGNRILAKVIPLFEKGRGNDLSSIKGTYWAAYNAVNEYLGYEKGSDSVSRLDSMWFGQNAVLNKKALDLALVMAA